MSFLCTQFDEFCRICAKRSSYNMKNLFGDANDCETLAEKIYQCTQIHLTQQINRPSKVCNQCAYKLEQAYEFYESVKNSEQTFQNMIMMPTLKSKTCTEQKPIPAELVEVKMETQDVDNIIEHDSAIVPIADMIDVIVGGKEEPTEYDSLEMEPIARKQQKKMTKKKITIPIEKRGRGRPGRMFECYRCKIQFRSFRKTSVHLRQHYAEEKFKCNVCGVRFILLDDYNQHLCQGTSIACSYCNEIFDTTNALLNHLEQSHEEKTLFKCEKCAKFYSMELLKQIHMLQHSEQFETEDSKPFGCNVCKKRFANRLSLRNHKEIHSEEKRKLPKKFYTIH